MAVDARYVRMSLFELDPRFGTFDLVSCGSVLPHIWDQFTALRRLRSVCRGRVIGATAIMRSWLRRSPVARFEGLRANAGTSAEYSTTWKPNRAALVRMVESAGFREVVFR